MEENNAQSAKKKNAVVRACNYVAKKLKPKDKKSKNEPCQEDGKNKEEIVNANGAESEVKQNGATVNPEEEKLQSKPDAEVPVVVVGLEQSAQGDVTKVE